MTKAVVTGGAGFIGSHLAERLAGHGYHTVIVDDLSSGKMENITEFLRKGDTEFVRGSVTDFPLLKKIFTGADFVFHLAAIASVPRSIDDPRASFEVDVGGTLNVLLAARDSKVGKVIYSSSAAVYGDTATLPHKEDMLPHPMSPYAANKVAGEYYCRVFTEAYKLPTICLRYFNIYGLRQDVNSQYAAVIPRIIKDVQQGNSLTIFGDGEQTRDFTFVKDAVSANILAARNSVTGVFNIAQGKSVTINQLARTIMELLGKEIKPIHKEPRLGDIRHSLADINKAKTLGYNPEYDLKMGLTETIKSLA